MKSLEALDKIIIDLGYFDKNGILIWSEKSKENIKCLATSLEVLEIIKERKVNVMKLVWCGNAKDYNLGLPYENQLMTVEFDKVKKEFEK